MRKAFATNKGGDQSQDSFITEEMRKKYLSSDSQDPEKEQILGGIGKEMISKEIDIQRNKIEIVG